MTVTFCLQTEPNNKVDKSCNGASYTGTLRDTCSLMNPSITFNKPMSTFAGFNYFKITLGGIIRHYYVTDVKSITRDLTEVSGHVDVLSGSFGAQLKKCTGTVCRSEDSSIYNLNLNDACFKVMQQHDTQFIEFPNDVLSDDTAILVLGGV